jgi:hypothetical protein
MMAAGIRGCLRGYRLELCYSRNFDADITPSHEYIALIPDTYIVKQYSAFFRPVKFKNDCRQLFRFEIGINPPELVQANP